MEVRPLAKKGLSHYGDTVGQPRLWPIEEQEGMEGDEENEDAEFEQARIAEGHARGEEKHMEVEVEAEEEEAEVARVRGAPKGPTKKEREEHDATHLPYRSWC